MLGRQKYRLNFRSRPNVQALKTGGAGATSVVGGIVLTPGLNQDLNFKDLY